MRFPRSLGAACTLICLHIPRRAHTRPPAPARPLRTASAAPQPWMAWSAMSQRPLFSENRDTRSPLLQGGQGRAWSFGLAQCSPDGQTARDTAPSLRATGSFNGSGSGGRGSHLRPASACRPEANWSTAEATCAKV